MKYSNRIRYWRRSGVFIVSFEHISHLVLVFLLLTLNMQMPTGLFSFGEVFNDHLKEGQVLMLEQSILISTYCLYRYTENIIKENA